MGLQPPPPDSAAERADSQFATCKYVYDSPEKLRECLVLKQRWAPADAARRIAIYEAALRHTLDSLRSIDSARAETALFQQMAASAAAERRHVRDSLAAAAAAYWGSTADSLYYTNTPNCQLLYEIPRGKRRIFQTVEEAEGAGFRRTEERGCLRLISTDPQRWTRCPPHLAWKRPGLPKDWVPVLERHPEGTMALPVQHIEPHRSVDRVLSAGEARRLTDEVKADAAALWGQLLRLYEGHAHRALGYASWGAYFEAEFGQKKSHGYRLLQSGRVLKALTHSPMGESAPPISERVARELAPLATEPRAVREAWQAAVEKHGPAPTAAAVREVVAPRLGVHFSSACVWRPAGKGAARLDGALGGDAALALLVPT